MPKSTRLAKIKDAEEEAEDAEELEAYQEDSAFTSPIHEITYEHPGWKPGSFWTLRAQISDEDETAITEMTQRSVVKGVDNAQIAQWQREGKNPQLEILRRAETEQVETGRRATLSQLTVAWGGPSLTLPARYSIARDPETKQPIIHELAGTVPPCTPEWIRRLGRGVSEGTYWHLYPFWAGMRGPDEEERFRPESDDSLRSESEATGQAEAPVPASAA